MFDNGVEPVFMAPIPNDDYTGGHKYVYYVTLRKSSLIIRDEITPWTVYTGNVSAY
jgi:hypothetical protein